MNNKNQYFIAASLFILSVTLRIASNNSFVANFTPILALSLFAGSIFTNKILALVLPIITMLVGDIYFQLFTNTPGFYGASQIVNYVAYILIVLFGTQLKEFKSLNILGFSIASGLIFFIVSNLGVWLDTTYNLYPKTLAGLVDCFYLAIPFFKNTFMSTILFGAMFFGVYNVAIKKQSEIIFDFEQ